jgi:hypothetical protein
MRKLLAAAVIVAVSLGVAGCAQNAFVGHQNGWAGVWFGDVGVKGNGNNVTVQCGSNLRKLSIWGDCNTVTVEDGVTLVHVEFFGKDNTVTIPAGLLVRLTDWGKGNTLVRRQEVWNRMIETPYGPTPAVVPLGPATPIPTGTPVMPPPAEPSSGTEIPPEPTGEPAE